MQLPSNCVVPTHVAAEWARTNNGVAQYYGLCGGVRGLIGGFIGSTIRDPAFGGALYDVNNYPELNRSEEHTSELQSLMRISYAVFCLNKKKKKIEPIIPT